MILTIPTIDFFGGHGSEDLVPALRALAAKELWQNALDFFFEERAEMGWGLWFPREYDGVWHDLYKVVTPSDVCWFIIPITIDITP